MDRLYKKNIPSEYVEKKIKDTKYEPAKERLKTWKEVFDEYVGEKGVTKNNLDFREFVKSIKFLDNEENNKKMQKKCIDTYHHLVRDALLYKKDFEKKVQ